MAHGRRGRADAGAVLRRTSIRRSRQRLAEVEVAPTIGTLVVERLPDADTAEEMEAWWRAALVDLKAWVADRP